MSIYVNSKNKYSIIDKDTGKVIENFRLYLSAIDKFNKLKREKIRSLKLIKNE